MHLVNRLDCTWLYICDQMDAIVLIFSYIIIFYLFIYLLIYFYQCLYFLFHLILLLSLRFVLFYTMLIFSFHFSSFFSPSEFHFCLFLGINVTGVFTRLVVQNQHVIMCSHRNVSVFGYSLKIYGLKDSV